MSVASVEAEIQISGTPSEHQNFEGHIQNLLKKLAKLEIHNKNN